MKNLKARALCVLLCLSCLCATAQKKIPLNEPDLNRPRLYNDLPSKMNLRSGVLEFLLQKETGYSLNLALTDKFQLEGTVVSTSGDEDPSVRSVVVRLTNRPGTTLTISRVKVGDGYRYSGRMMNSKGGDAYELVSENASYVLQKKNFYDIVSE